MMSRAFSISMVFIQLNNPSFIDFKDYYAFSYSKLKIVLCWNPIVFYNSGLNSYII